MSNKFSELAAKLIERGFHYELWPNCKDRGNIITIGNKYGDAGDSLYMYKDSGIWQDGATGEEGGLIGLYAELNNISEVKAYELLAKKVGVTGELKQTPKEAFAEDKTDFFQAVQYDGNLDDEFLLNTVWRTSYNYKVGKADPSKIFKIFNKSGHIQFLIFRFEAKEGRKKDFQPFTYGIKGRETNGRWHNKLPFNPVPLYNLQNYKDTASQTIIVEGEKKCDLLYKYIGDNPNVNIVSWIGGSGKAARADWEALKGNKKILIIPDNDIVGNDAAKTIYNILSVKDCASEAVIIGNIPDDKEKGWDIGDFIEELEEQNKSEDEIIQEIASFIKHISKSHKTFKVDDGWTFDNHIHQNIRDLKKFTCLGYGANGDSYYFYSDSRNEVLEYNAKDLKNTAKLKALADEKFWYACYREESRQGMKLNLNAIETALIVYCKNKGRFDTDKKRLVGSYNDEDRVVVHLGDKLLVNGKEKRLDLESENIYEAELGRINLNTEAEIMTVNESKAILESLKSLKFRDAMDLRFLIGWYFAAPLSGIWEWRSHLWMIGESGAGKSTVAELLNGLFSNFKRFYNDATEAGIRADLKSRTLPVIFDEFEKNQDMTDAVLRLMRTGSSDTDADITKGSSGGGGAVKYRIRSMFFALSTMSGLKLIQDNNRFTTITLQKNNNFDEYKNNLMKLGQRWKENNYSDKFLMRAFKMGRVMRSEWSRFKVAITDLVKDSRDGDQLATLTIGAWFFVNDNPPTDEELEAFIEPYKNYAKEKKTGLTDFETCWQMLASQPCKMEIINHEGYKDYFTKTVGELILHLLREEEDSRIGHDKNAERALSKMGVKFISRSELAISNTHPALEALFRKTNWDNFNWNVGFARGSGLYYKGINDNKPMRFAGITSKVIILDPSFLLTQKEAF
jgi:energy-coupling factor transporter ATP-binding protein EcfA2